MFDAIVVGAGPGGSSAAFHLARRGRRVLLLDRKEFPRDKSCGDGLTRPAVALLADMGVLTELSAAQRVRGVRVQMRGQAGREFLYPKQSGGLVVPRLELDHILCQRAVAVGAELRTGLRAERLVRDGDLVCGVEVCDGTRTSVLRAHVVIAADGAASPLAHQAGLAAPGQMGFAIRGYYTGIDPHDDLLDIRLPLLDSTDRYLLPSYGWVFPTGSGTANIGVGLFRRDHGANVRQMMERFIDDLRRTDPRFVALRACGHWRGAPLRFDFAPERCAAPGLLLVGDAAGLISPFTGEGISFALESGRCAAEVIHDALSQGSVRDLSEYGSRLGAQHAGYFELGRQSARRYVLLWHVLESTFHNDKPLFALTRQAALFPEGVGEAYLGARLPNVRSEVGSLASTLRADLAAASDVLANAVRTDWPFLARLAAVDQHDSAVPFRPALLMLLSTLCGGTTPPHAPALAAAVELGYLSTLAQLSVLDESTTAGESAGNWGNRFAVIVADFLLTRAYEISARSGVGVTQLIASSLATACESRTREMRHARGARLTPPEYDEMITCKTGALFELPCVLGARLANLSVADSNLLGTFGRHLGAAIQIAEDVRGASGVPREFSLSTDADPDEGLLGLPLLLALDRADAGAASLRTLLTHPRSDRDHQSIAKLLERTGVLDDAFASAIAHRDQAVAQVEMLAASPARDALKAIAYRLVTREP